MANAGPHGFTEVLYAYTSATGNNGSAFGGLTGNTIFYNLTLACSMLVGRFFMIVPAMALGGALLLEKRSIRAIKPARCRPRAACSSASLWASSSSSAVSRSSRRWRSGRSSSISR
jgi:hypothetical protein